MVVLMLSNNLPVPKDEDSIHQSHYLDKVGRDHDDAHALVGEAGDQAIRISYLVLMSIPTVGSSMISSSGIAASHLPRLTFCLLPPLRLATT